ncbi:MAG: SPOR domain-containing protein [Campylobacterota bacterium]|nr:SPOR domain-containing protein [Campylobacterota bacterium]
MEEKTELNDIILNKNNTENNNKKIILAVATLGVVLIIVVMLMNSLSSNNDNLPQPILSEALLPPEPKMKNTLDEIDEPLFEDIEIIEEDSSPDDSLDMIAQRLKQESLEEANFIADTKPKYTPPVKKVVHVEEPIETVKQPIVSKPTPKVVEEKRVNPQYVDKRKTAQEGKYYLQVGSFSTFEPNKKFLKSITDKGFTYKYHEVTINSKKINKVLIGPFSTKKDARDALRTVRSSVEAGAFLTEI